MPHSRCPSDSSSETDSSATGAVRASSASALTSCHAAGSRARSRQPPVNRCPFAAPLPAASSAVPRRRHRRPVTDCVHQRSAHSRRVDEGSHSRRRAATRSQSGTFKRREILAIGPGLVECQFAPGCTLEADRVKLDDEVEIATSLRDAQAQVVRSATLIPGFSPPKRGPRFRPTGTPLQARQFREVRFYPIPPVCLLQRQPEAPANEQDGHYQACRQNCRMSRVSAHPLGSALRKAGRPRRNGLISLEPLEIFQESGSAGIPPLRILVQALQADRLQVARHLRVQPRRRRRARHAITCRSVSVAVSPRNGGRPVSIS